MGRDPDQAVPTQQSSGRFELAIVLAQMNSVGAGRDDEVGAVVENQQRAGVITSSSEATADCDQRLVLERLVSQLDDVDPGGERLRQPAERRPAPRARVDDQVQTRGFETVTQALVGGLEHRFGSFQSALDSIGSPTTANGNRHDVAVIGAGAIGLACGWRIAAAGMSVAVFDRFSPGAGASGVAAGMLAPVTEADFGATGLLELNLAGEAAWPAFAAELETATGRELGFARSGALIVASDRDDAEELRRLQELQSSLGLESSWLGASAARELETGLSPGIAGAVSAPGDGAVNPRALLSALAVALDAAGGELVVGVDARLRIEQGRVVGIASHIGDFEAQTVVLAAGAWSGAVDGLPDALDLPLRPVKGQILRMRRPTGMAPLAQRIVRSPRCYIVDRAGGEVVIGATTEDRGFDQAVTAGAVHRLLEAAWELLPDVAELELVETAAGLRPATPDNEPLIGRVPEVEGLILATGHGRNGILLAPGTADAVAALASGGELPEPFARCSLERFVTAAGRS